MSTERNRAIIYLLSIEDIVRSPIVRSQSLEVLNLLVDQLCPYYLYIVSLYPITSCLRNHKELIALRRNLAHRHIRLQILPIPYLTRHFYIPKALLPLYNWIARTAAKWIIRQIDPCLVHCRSYPAALVGHFIKGQNDCKLVFDPRSLYPEEGASRVIAGKHVMFDAQTYSKWKSIESDLITASDAVITVSQPFADILAEQYPHSKAQRVTIPTAADVIPPAQIEIHRALTRKKLGCLDNDTVVAYVGTWFDYEAFMELVQLLRQALPDTPWRFLLIVSGLSSQKGKHLRASLEQKLDADLGQRYHLLSLPQAQVHQYLAGADIAVQIASTPADKKQDTRYQLMARTVISVKFAEYLASGLPVVVSKWAGAAADIVRKHNLGLVYDEATIEELRSWLVNWQAEPDDFRQRARDFAHAHFSLETVTESYLTIYKQLLETELL